METHPKNVKVWLLGDEQWIHKVFDFLVINFEGQQGFLPWTKTSSLDVGMISKKKDNNKKKNENSHDGSLFKQ